MLAVTVVALAGLAVAAIGLAQGPNVARVAAGLGLQASYVAAAKKWSLIYSVPLEWVLATILVESGGNPRARGDAGGKSVGLMQVNVAAHAQDGATLEKMLDPATNIQFGTMYLRQFKDKVEDALAGRTPPIPESWIVRLAYKGPTTVLGVLQKGGNPATISWAPEALHRWAAALAKVSALTGRQVA